MNLDIVILAAGKGTRMCSEKPKVLHTVGAKSLLGHVVDTASQLTDRPLQTIVGHGVEQIKEAFSQNANIHFVFQEQQLGTGHAVQQALPYLDKDSITLILYGDVPLTEKDTLERLITHVDDQTLALLTLTLEDSTGYGRIVRDQSGDVSAIVEQKDATEAQLAIKEINTGILAVKSHYLHQWLPSLQNSNAQGEFYLTDIIAMAVNEGVRIQTEQPTAEWEVLGVNDRRQQAELERIHQRKQAEALMKKGVTLKDPSRFDLRGSMTCGKDVSIDINCLFEGNVTLGHGVSVGPNCVLKNCNVSDGVSINANSMIEDSTVGEGSIIGPFARLRPGTQLASQTKVGNFVETKKAIVGEGSKINHLSYVGDAQLGSDVNIGAGTITCNYDGVNKHQTIIEDNAFIGSNSALVAPVKIEEGATIGAGSTISKDAPKETLTLTRSPQKSLRNWQRPEKK